MYKYVLFVSGGRTSQILIFQQPFFLLDLIVEFVWVVEILKKYDVLVSLLVDELGKTHFFVRYVANLFYADVILTDVIVQMSMSQ